MHDVDKDPLLPKCFKEYPEIHKEAKEWVVNQIRTLRPNWWQAAKQRYDEAFYHHGVYRSYQEINARRKIANLWLMKTVKQYS